MLPLLPSRFPPEHERKRSRKYEYGRAHPLGNDEAVHDDFPPKKESEKMRERKNRKYDGMPCHVLTVCRLFCLILSNLIQDNGSNNVP